MDLKSLSRLDHHKETYIGNNLIRECQAHFGIDLDDGCSYYTVQRNLCIGTGIKLREGYCRTVKNNVLYGRPMRKGVCYRSNGDVIERNIIVRTQEADVWNSVMGAPEEASRIDCNLYYVYSARSRSFYPNRQKKKGFCLS